MTSLLTSNQKNYQELLVSHVQDIDFYTRFKKLGDRLQADDIPGGAKHLDTIGQALADNQRLRIEYLKFADDISKHLTVEPYCLKTKDRRWYMLARNVETGEMRTYALDRITNLEPAKEHFTPDPDIDIRHFYSNCIGEYTNNTEFTDVTIRVNELQAKYLRTFPLHESQLETAICEFKKALTIYV